MSSLEEVYKMTWREFQLRLMAYKRMDNRTHAIARQITYYAGYDLNVKKPKPIEKFWKIEDDKPEVSDEMKERMKAAMKTAWSKVKK